MTSEKKLPIVTATESVFSNISVIVVLDMLVLTLFNFNISFLPILLILIVSFFVWVYNDFRAEFYDSYLIYEHRFYKKTIVRYETIEYVEFNTNARYAGTDLFIKYRDNSKLQAISISLENVKEGKFAIRYLLDEKGIKYEDN